MSDRRGAYVRTEWKRDRKINPLADRQLKNGVHHNLPSTAQPASSVRKGPPTAWKAGGLSCGEERTLLFRSCGLYYVI